ncbi:Stf0 family sulfotransferase [Mycolicibacterium sp.]|uniref:Stf0 family sulfotransferase n=1 Tax=Mycolicibacterium sp. TaxID=2320850 RepID=UPI0028AA0733|nr:Stf0 family sulfotransferase [Mycolicibacterium sp.]
MASNRPDVVDLIGPEFDCELAEPAPRTLIICAAPRTGSYELARHLAAAGVGVPHEYFNPNYARRLAARWGLSEQPLSEETLPEYVEFLRLRRAQNGVFATKLQFGQFERFLRNSVGATLFENATFIHLYRPDAASQFGSLRAALESGRWDFSDRQTTTPSSYAHQEIQQLVAEALRQVDTLIAEDAGFRRLFILLGIKPVFATTDELSRNPETIVRRIGELLATPLNEERLQDSLRSSAPYGRGEQARKAFEDLGRRFKELAFEKDSETWLNSVERFVWPRSPD